MLLAWRPDGRRLAVVNLPDTVSLFDSASGSLLATLSPAVKSGASSQATAGVDALRWSPDGSRLAFYDPNVGTLTIWHVAQ